MQHLTRHKVKHYILLIAIVLLFTSCCKEEDERVRYSDEDTPGSTSGGGSGGGQNGGQNGGQTLGENSNVTIVFDGETIALDRYDAVVDDNKMPYIFSLAACRYNENLRVNRLPQIQIVLEYDTVNNPSQKWNVDHFMYSHDSVHFEELKHVDAKVKAEYMFDNIEALQFTHFDSEPVSLSFEATAMMKSFYEHAVMGVSEDNVSRKRLKVTINNIVFRNGTLR